MTSHNSTVPSTTTNSEGIRLYTRNPKGSGNWKDTLLCPGDVYPHFAIGGHDGKSIHLFTTKQGPYLLQDEAVLYYRSTDAGTTWDAPIVIGGINDSYYLGFDRDTYSVDAKGDTVAVVLGGLFTDVVLLKSIDNGVTWTKTIVKQFDVPFYNYHNTTLPLTESTDGSVHVMLDNQGKAHVFYPRMSVQVQTAGQISYDPLSDSIMYWNEYSPVVRSIAGVKDYNGDGFINIYNSPDITSYLPFGLYQKSLTSLPSAGIDANGRLYLTYSSLFEGLNENGEGLDIGKHMLVPPTIPGRSYRHQYIIRSDDNGATWFNPVDITQPDYGNMAYDKHEGVYGTMAKRVDNYIHIVGQDDSKPGHGQLNADTDNGIANIIYYQIPITSSDSNASVIENNIISQTSIYPNPSVNSAVTLSMTSSEYAKVNITIYNAVGQEMTTIPKSLFKGNNTVQLDLSNFARGIYMICPKVNGVTCGFSKLIVE
jgi:hypothetical protein